MPDERPCNIQVCHAQVRTPKSDKEVGISALQNCISESFCLEMDLVSAEVEQFGS